VFCPIMQFLVLRALVHSPNNTAIVSRFLSLKFIFSINPGIQLCRLTQCMHGGRHVRNPSNARLCRSGGLHEGATLEPDWHFCRRGRVLLKEHPVYGIRYMERVYQTCTFQEVVSTEQYFSRNCNIQSIVWLWLYSEH